jgi:hypothetical protein
LVASQTNSSQSGAAGQQPHIRDEGRTRRDGVCDREADGGGGFKINRFLHNKRRLGNFVTQNDSNNGNVLLNSKAAFE